jgi:hypothetical protein
MLCLRPLKWETFPRNGAERTLGLAEFLPSSTPPQCAGRVLLTMGSKGGGWVVKLVGCVVSAVDWPPV